LDKEKYDVVPVGIDKSGCFHFGAEAIALRMPTAVQMIYDMKQVGVLADACCSAELPLRMDSDVSKFFDVVFPVFHGTFGEDGIFQGLLRMFSVPFVGAGVLGSAIGMDKDVTKRLLRDAGIRIAQHLTFGWHECDRIVYEDVRAILGDVIFVKPASLGSSVGVSKVRSRQDFIRAIDEAFSYDSKVILEEFIYGREIECSVLGNEYPEASLPGEIILKRDFYSYSAKYLDEDAADLKIPANLSAEIVEEIRHIALKAYKVLCCEGMARVDFFLKNNREIFLNEINTIPGFTEEISMYPKLWAVSGLPYPKLLDKLIELAIFRHKKSLSQLL
jgi:D-alanine-D-alanine ligase